MTDIFVGLSVGSGRLLYRKRAIILLVKWKNKVILILYKKKPLPLEKFGPLNLWHPPTEYMTNSTICKGDSGKMIY